MKLMKLVMDERVKHRLTGVVVLVSIAVIFVPAMIKKSNQRLGENITVSIKLPPKPVLPEVAMVQEKAIFNTMKVASIAVPTIAAAPPASQLASAAPAAMKLPKTSTQLASVIAPVKATVVPASKVAVQSIKAPVVKTGALPNKITQSIANKVALAKEGGYVIQLASFTQQRNAEMLVNRLRTKGYKANYSKAASKQGEVYKVMVGQLNRRDDALLLQKKLADSMQLSGFIIKAEVI
jgi:DedD protein